MTMSKGKDPQSADGLGGVHKVVEPRARVPHVPRDPDPVVVGYGRADDARLVDDPDQIARVVHTQPAPVEPAAHTNAPESELRPARTPQAPFQDAQVSPAAASVWTAEKAPGD
jgi:hypothetical protein